MPERPHGRVWNQSEAMTDVVSYRGNQQREVVFRGRLSVTEVAQNGLR